MTTYYTLDLMLLTSNSLMLREISFNSFIIFKYINEANLYIQLTFITFHMNNYLLHNEHIVKLSDFKGKKNIVLFFYPKSFTSGCTRENRSFAQNYPQFTSLDTEVLIVKF